MLRSSSKLSESLLWQLGKNAYAHFGIDCWKSNAVPFHITSNSRIAAQYARIAAAADRGEPMTFLELGGGSGKFAYLFLSELLQLGVSPIRYILTDFAEKNVAFWNAHPRFLPWIEQGLLHTVHYDPLISNPLAASPDFVIANYLFNAIPQDLFRVEAGRLFEAKAHLQVDDEGVSWDDPEILSKILDTYVFEPLKTLPYPGLPAAGSILDDYRNWDAGTFFMPIGAFRLIGRLKEFCKPGFLLLTADRGPWTEAQLRASPPPQMSRHLTFSFPVNFHAIGQFVEKLGGEAALSDAPSPTFGAALFSLQPIEASLKRAIANERFGPLQIEASERSQILDLLDQANWDATLFFSFFERLQGAEGEEKERVAAGALKIPNRFFPLFREEARLLDRLGFWFQDQGLAQQARDCFETARKFQMLPRQAGDLEPVQVFLKNGKPAGDVLQIGGNEEYACAIRSYRISSHLHISWDRRNEAIGRFDQIYLFLPKGCFKRKAKKPEFVREIEEQFPILESIAYADRDIDVLLNCLSLSDREHAVHFFCELERKGQIAAKQLDRALQRLGLAAPAPEREIQVFETLKRCLDRHWKEGSVLRCYVEEGISFYDDPKIFDGIIVDPSLHFEETQDSFSQAIWVTITQGTPNTS